jgi:hypothetical protein
MDGIRRDAPPRVLQTALQGFYVRYTLVVSLDDPSRWIVTVRYPPFAFRRASTCSDISRNVT